MCLTVSSGLHVYVISRLIKPFCLQPLFFSHLLLCLWSNHVYLIFLQPLLVYIINLIINKRQIYENDHYYLASGQTIQGPFKTNYFDVDQTI